MKMASGFGDYFPDGAYSEWDEQLRQFSCDGLTEQRKQTILQSMRRYPGWISAAFTQEIGVSWGGMSVPSPLDEELPKMFRTIRAYRTLGSLIELNERLLAVDEDLRAIIEDLEPGLHRFWPIRIVMPKNVEYPRRYFGVLVGRFLDSFLPEKSNPDSFRASETIFTPKGQVIDSLVGLAFDASVIGTAHFWRERRFPIPNLYLSDALKTRIDAAGLRVPKCRRIAVL